ncbi:hypothetical protein N7488_011765 [Penicillium malachiteum]|nr:hypothetical protein N7488_011765 [Penicillium malachiteum]
MDSYFTPTIPRRRTTVTIRVESCDKEFIVPRRALMEKSEYFRIMFSGNWLESQARAATMQLVPGVVSPTNLSMFLRWVFTDKIEYDGDPEGENILMTERLTILISLARFADMIICPTMAAPIEVKVRFIMLGHAAPFLDVSASQADSENGRETEEADDDNENSNDSSESEVVDPDHQYDHLDPGFFFEEDINTRYLVSAHIIQAVKLPASNRIRRTIIDSCLKGYFSRRPFRFEGLIENCPGFATDLLRSVPLVLEETMSYADGTVLFWDPVTGVSWPMYQANTTGSRWRRARRPHRHEPSRLWHWNFIPS